MIFENEERDLQGWKTEDGVGNVEKWREWRKAKEWKPEEGNKCARMKNRGEGGR